MMCPNAAISFSIHTPPLPPVQHLAVWISILDEQPRKHALSLLFRCIRFHSNASAIRAAGAYESFKKSFKQLSCFGWVDAREKKVSVWAGGSGAKMEKQILRAHPSSVLRFFFFLFWKRKEDRRMWLVPGFFQNDPKCTKRDSHAGWGESPSHKVFLISLLTIT